eukprot:scaffold22352_cov17-Tisochrysis_lutea.AAC.1
MLLNPGLPVSPAGCRLSRCACRPPRLPRKQLHWQLSRTATGREGTGGCGLRPPPLQQQQFPQHLCYLMTLQQPLGTTAEAVAEVRAAPGQQHVRTAVGMVVAGSRGSRVLGALGLLHTLAVLPAVSVPALGCQLLGMRLGMLCCRAGHGTQQHWQGLLRAWNTHPQEYQEKRRGARQLRVHTGVPLAAPKCGCAQLGGPDCSLPPLCACCCWAWCAVDCRSHCRCRCCCCSRCSHPPLVAAAAAMAVQGCQLR